ncbi:MAG TPA: hypothetical protein VN843_35585, partial [Anaerolineales bacterium]|nr:hypothetical protein [Anaerolineales bacterium]
FLQFVRRSDPFSDLIHDSGYAHAIIPWSQYYSADSFSPLTVYDPPDIRWDVLTSTLSQYYL